jgi:hypothetical protein
MPDPRVISFKCKCFRLLGRRFVYPRNDTVTESVRFDVESLQTSASYHFKPNVEESNKAGPLTVRPTRIHSGQKIAISFFAGFSEVPIAVYFDWFDITSFKEVQVWDGVGSGMMNIQLAAPRLPKDRLMGIRVECGSTTLRKPIWSNGDKISRDWKLSNSATVNKNYCCPDNVGDQNSCEEVSYYTYDTDGSDLVCRNVLFAFTTLNGLVNGSGIVDLSEYKNSGLPIHTKWSLEEIGYYGEERPVVYKWGDVIDGVLVGLPDFWTPPNYGYPGYMNLVLRC